MKGIIVFIVMALVVANVYAQKSLIDTDVYGKWPGIGASNLTAKGNYFCYDLDHQLTIKELRRSWEITISNCAYGGFANNDRVAVFITDKDSLGIQTLKSDRKEWIAGVKSFRIAENEKADWLFYQTNTDDKKLVAKNLINGRQTCYLHVWSYQFVPGGKDALIQQRFVDSSLFLGLLNLSNNKLVSIWRGKAMQQLVFAADGQGLAFIGNDPSGKKAIWYYHSGDTDAQKLNLNEPANIQNNFDIDRLIGFDGTGNKLFFKLRQSSLLNTLDPDLVSVDIYNYSYPLRRRSKEMNKSFTYVFNLSSRKQLALESRDEHILGGTNVAQCRDYILELEYNDDANKQEWNWNPVALCSVYLLSTIDGSRIYLAKDIPYPVLSSYCLSPDEKYVAYYDLAQKDYFSYNISTGVTLDITKGANTNWIDQSTDGLPDSAYHVNPDYHWPINDGKVLVNDGYDIYEADLAGKSSVICLTGHYGHTNHIRFSLTKINGKPEAVSRNNQSILLKAFNEETKEEGFCKVVAGRENNIDGLKMLPCHIDEAIQKAADADVYVLRMETAESAPNLFATTDFKTYRRLTDIHPERSFNWLTSELVTWKQPDGSISQGILYKPENFDPKKRYPVIFHYYERLSDHLHQYLTPAYSSGEDLDIPTYVSKGYLVFEPDIHYQIGHPGKGALDAIVSAAAYLKQFSWVDQNHMGLMGHSFGGYETNYVITHSHLFAAAVSLSGVSDFVSGYDSGPVYNNRQFLYETGQNRIGATLWQRPDLYIENSPIFNADKVTTPVLLMSNKNDGSVPYEQGFEFFTALRRLQKKAWLLQYDKGNHAVILPITDNKDITLRMRQFFNYYLKGKTPPVWMVEGVPPSEKEIESGFTADTTGRNP